jgi:GNAT superfamily N-acetyltransferase
MSISTAPTSAAVSITIKRTKDLQPNTKRQIDMLTHAEFGAIDLVRRYQWAEPDWIASATIGREIVSFVGLLKRTVLFDGKPMNVCGISNAVTPPEHRRKGYARALMEQIELFIFKDLKADCGLLLCRDHLVSYYQSLGWYTVSCPLVFNQQDGKKTWAANTMLCTQPSGKFAPSNIDLQSLPW